ncbi:undecaprenyldiphospho-muramoylpentapeptide beta-N-acetylglucosaminyltransferase [Phragmitibacter flavus]|nr:undecaprenyldiphospho-muramoylpentapeptide beta-N-acetylglucosaminyltransferase [Phragmitibacter flavus]
MARSNQFRLHVLIACGGTGGHLYPGIAVGEVLRARRHTVTLLISEKKIDALAASAHPELRFEKLPYLAMPSPLSPKMPKFLMGVWKGLRQCKAMIKKENIRVVLGMGGFTSFAPILAGRQCKVKTLIHDSNAIPGKANRLTSRYCDEILLGFGEAAAYFPKHLATQVTGTPVRSALRQAANDNKEDPYAFFGLNPNLKTLLIIGGSQGARGVNNAVTHSLDQLDALGVQLLHITGPGDYQEVCDAYQTKEIKLRSHIAAFCHRMELAYRVADMAVARSGASTLAELAYFGVPSLLVPYPTAADDHQTKNAAIFDKAGAGILVSELELSPEKLAAVVGEILNDSAKSQRMSQAAQQISCANAAERIADAIEQLVDK